MKLKPVPTSPQVYKKDKVVKEIYSQSNSKTFEKPPIRSKNGLFIVILAIVAGFLAGLLGEIIINALAVSYPNLPAISYLYPNIYSDESKVIIQRTEKSLDVLEFEVQETLRKIRPAVVTIFPKNSNTNKSDSLAQTYQMSEAIGNGIILTDDGLVMTSRQVIADSNSEYVVVTSDKKIYSITEINTDPVSAAVFFRIDAKSLPMVEFIDPADLKVGQRLISLVNKIDGAYQTVFTEIRDLYYTPYQNRSDLIFSSELFSDNILLTNKLPEGFLAAPLLTLNGKVIGIALYQEGEAAEINLVLPAQHFRPVIPRILKKGEIERAFLGIHYLDLSRMINIPKELSQDLEKGAVIYGENALNLPAIINQSPAQNADLTSGDIIIKVNNTAVDLSNSLTELIQELEPKKAVELVILRDGKEETIKLELKKFTL